MNDNLMNMKLLTALCLALSLSACSQGFSTASSGAGSSHFISGGDSVTGDPATVASSDGGPAGPSAPGGDPGVRPKADPEIVYPMGVGGPAVTVSAFRAFDGGALTHLLDPNAPMTLPSFDYSANLRLLVQANTGTAAAPQWSGDLSDHVRVILAPTGGAANENNFCDIPIITAPDGSNANAALDGVAPGNLLLYYRSNPYPASQWVDCASPVPFSSISVTASSDFTGSVNPIEYLGSYHLNPHPLPPPGGGGGLTGGLPE